MIARGRIELAAHDGSIVVATSGLLAVFNDAGVLGPLDVLAAQSIGRLCGEGDERVLLGAAMAVRGTRFGHVCVRLGALRAAVVVDGQDAEVIDGLPWPEPDSWESLMRRSDVVGDGAGDEPLVLVDGRLYLERYFRYEEHVAALLADRSAQAMHPLGPGLGSVLDRLLPVDGDAPSRQHAAAVLAATGKLAVIAGGPGTGKTHTVGALLAAMAEADELPLVAVCAPPARRQRGSAKRSRRGLPTSPTRRPGSVSQRCSRARSTACSVGRGNGGASTTMRRGASRTTSSSSTRCRWCRCRWPPSCSKR